jgi:hypothetical protein
MGEGVQMWEREGMQERVCKGRQRQREGASEGGERECLQERAPEGVDFPDVKIICTTGLPGMMVVSKCDL